MKNLLLAFSAVLCLGSVSAGTTYVVQSGETLSMGGAGSSKSGVTDVVNQRGNVIDLRDGATLCVTNNGHGCWRTWPHVICTNGTAYLVRGENDTGGTVEIRRALHVTGDGKLRVKGFSTVTFGVDASGSEFFGSAIFDVADLGFVNAGGETSTGTLALTGPGSIMRIPDAEHSVGVTLKWGNGGVGFVLPPGNQWSEQDDFTFFDSAVKTIFVGDRASLKAGCNVTVPAGCTFGVIPSCYSASDPYLREIDFNEGVFSNDVNVTLADTTSLLCLTNYQSVVFLGDIGGSGAVNVGVNRTGTVILNTTLCGDNTYTGPTTVTSDRINLIFGASVPTGPVRIQAATATVGFLPPAEGGAEEVTLSSYYGKYYSTEIRAAAGQKVTVLETSGRVYAHPLDETAQIDFNPAVGGVSLRYYDSPQVTFNGTTGDAAGVPAVNTGSETLRTFPLADGTVNWSAQTPAVNAPWCAVSNKASFANLPTEFPLRVRADSEVSFVDKSGTSVPKVDVLLENGASFAANLGDGWTNAAALWVDPNALTTVLSQPGDLAREEWIAKLGTPSLTRTTGGYPLVEGLSDCRTWQTYYSVRNARAYNYVNDAKDPKYDGAVSSVFAVLKSDGPNGLKYLDCAYDGNSRRMPVGVGQIAANEGCSIKATLVVMAFDSSKGGGKAIVGTTEGAFARTADKNSPIVSSAVDADIWVDGQKVADPTTDKLGGTWQVISVDLSKYTLNGFGWIHNYSDSGGSTGPRYGEIVVFTNAVSAACRQRVESYLAKKWGVSAYTPDASVVDGELILSGHGTASVDDVTVTAGGSFRGTLTMDGTTLRVPSALPWSEKDIPTANRLLWFDPTDAASLYLETRERQDAVRGLFQRGVTLGTAEEEAYFLYGTGSRRPYLRRWTRGFGAERPWIDFEHAADHVPGSSDGNVIRIKKWYKDLGISSDDYSNNRNLGIDHKVGGRTYFIVSDSCRGGGDVLRTAVGSGQDFGSRGNYPLASAAIWNNANAKVSGGTTRLNGLDVATPTSTGFTGEPEVLSVCATAAANFGAIGNYVNTESATDPVTGKKYAIPTFGHGEMVGELLVFDSELAADVRKNIENYLLNKWVGRLQAGYVDWREATIDGTGTVQAESLSVAPKLASTFAGTLALTESEAAPTLDIAVDAATGIVTGGLVAPGTTVAQKWIGNPVLNVTVTGIGYGEFALVDLAGISPAVTWTVNVTTVHGLAEVVQSDGGATVKVKIIPRGTMILIR